ncbi:hypothetical protein TVAG_177430 [Trichomonas vaginalis G3]|uniref:Signal peptidase complex subunit 1 n=1 Tax=Trichomonas vaginalis (strain ATCC PRA-98 / G3) TaxID=412133 RepID=A2FMN5_TRIV3|nr:Microsomal signal peptidase 12 kDa subunit (SPC12) family [Trichomonas vaginalis G3]EAX93835.1 hypothetical protein TVAG_177430 [Trichomonas vaginalis G3]KAI5490921.1 Microsomal signal peptidase 12 kDa subunit (SPC12) family [Trichomonas vaginalis G3]|eukprot:XP_001306765.1 hypothetical protein [Trichomonas vaginalis G3]
MVDFQGQSFIFWTSAALLTLSVPIAIIYAFIVDNYLKGLMVIVYLSAGLFIAFVPNWPWLNRNKPNWQPDTAYKDPAQENKKKDLNKRRKN